MFHRSVFHAASDLEGMDAKSGTKTHSDMCIVCRVHEKEANMIQVVLHDLATGESTKIKQKSGVTVCICLTIFHKYMREKIEHPEVSRRIGLAKCTFFDFFEDLSGFLVIWNHNKNLTRKVLLWDPFCFGIHNQLWCDQRMKVAGPKKNTTLSFVYSLMATRCPPFHGFFMFQQKGIFGTSHVCWLEKLASFRPAFSPTLCLLFRTWWGRTMEITGLSSSSNPLR